MENGSTKRHKKMCSSRKAMRTLYVLTKYLRTSRGRGLRRDVT